MKNTQSALIIPKIPFTDLEALIETIHKTPITVPKNVTTDKVVILDVTNKHS